MTPEFKGRHFEGEVILWAVRWYCRYGISYRELEEMLAERGVSENGAHIASTRASPFARLLRLPV